MSHVTWVKVDVHGFVLERKSFDVPIAKQQMIQQKIADMEVKIESSRLLTYKAACLKDNGKVWVIKCDSLFEIKTNIFSHIQNMLQWRSWLHLKLLRGLRIKLSKCLVEWDLFLICRLRDIIGMLELLRFMKEHQKFKDWSSLEILSKNTLESRTNSRVSNILWNYDP